MADYNELFKLDSSDKQIEISVDGRVVITNAELFGEKFELSEVLCADNQLRFGQCNASSVKFQTANILTVLIDKIITITISINDEDPFLIGSYKVISDTPTADRHSREIVAYDVMYDILNANVSEWYKDFFENNVDPTLKDFRDSFFAYLGVTQETTTLPQDSMPVEETIGGTDISGKTIITSICEINGCFGHIGRDGKFQYVFLSEIGLGLYPSVTLYPSPDLYPTETRNTNDMDRSCYYEVQYEDYVSKRINKLQIRQNEDDIGCIYGVGDNCYIVEDNILVYGKSSEDLEDIASILFDEISVVEYRPASVKAKGNLTIPIGAIIALNTSYKNIYTYILERKLHGVMALFDEYSAEGTEYHNENLNSVNRSLFQLKGKTNELERTIEETRSTITDVEAGLESEIRQTASTLETSLKAYTDTKSAAARTNAGTDTDAKLANYSTTSQMNSAIQQSAQSITTQVSSTYATQASVQTQIDNLQAQIDDSIDTFTGPDVPTLNNYPAEDWTTTQLKDQHIGDLYVVNSQGGAYAGYYYRFEKANGVYQWSILDDTEVSKALADAGAALALAQGVRDDLDVNYYTKSETNSQISQSAGTITSTVSATYETKVEATSKLNTAKDYAEDYTDGKLTLYSNTAQMNSAITQSANAITTQVAATYETKSNATSRYNSLSSSITQTASSITAEVSRAQNAEEELAASISINADAINLKVSKGDVSSQISQEAGAITINSNRIAINSTNFTLSANGTIKATNGEFTGKITASSGTIGGFTIGSSSIYNRTTSMSSSVSGVYVGTDGINIGGKFKVTDSGSITVNGTGTITLSQSVSSVMELSYSGIYFGGGTWNTQITKDKIQIRNTYIDNNTFHCAKYNSLTTYYTEINGNVIDLVPGSSSYKTTISDSGISVKDGVAYSLHNSHSAVFVSGGGVSLNSDKFISIGVGYNSGANNTKIGFFGQSGSTRPSVSTLSSTASVSTVVTKVNEIINDLKAFGLFK